TGTATELLDQDQVDDGSVTNVVTAEGTDPAGDPVEDDDTNIVPIDQTPAIDIDKVTVHEGTEGDGLTGVATGDEVSWKYTVTNIGNVTLTDLSILDDHGALDPDFGTADGGIIGVELGGFNIGDTDTDGELDVGEAWTFVSSFAMTVEEGLLSYSNEATVTANTTAPEQQVTDSDTSGFYILPPGMVTNSALCDFGEVFQANFSPNNDGGFTQNSTNPGQFFYNVAFDYDEEFTNGDGTDNVLTMKIPDGFVLQSPDAFFENAVHVYDSVSVEFDPDGNICLVPGEEISRDLYTVEFNYLPDGSMEAVVNFGDADLTGLTYVNIHLDYETKGSSGWTPTPDEDATGGEPIPGYELGDIPENWLYQFDAVLTDGATTSTTDFSDAVSNDNVFKPFKMAGFGGYVWDDGLGSDDMVYEDGEGISGALLRILDKSGTLVDTAITDDDGWWYSDYVHKGKLSNYTIELHADGSADGPGTEDASVITSLGRGEKYDRVDFYQDDSDIFHHLEVA
uniref:DUF7507 domain-containing protein n=1 Tax=Pseudodonghicola xiamenensis TaxID=337702 RepID=UPI000480F24A